MLNIEKAMEHSQMGYARHKVVYDESGKPADYIFLSINHAFERLTGTKKEDILNRRITQVMPKITQDEFDWIGYYGELAETGQNKVFEQYSYSLDKWYRVEAFSCEQGYFTTIFTDITHERELTEASRDFLNDGNTSNTYEQITQRMKRITGADYVAMNVFLEEGGHFQTVAFAGVPGALQKAVHLLGFNPEKKEWPPDPYRFELIKDNRVTTFDHLHELTSHVLSKTAIQLVEKTFHLGQTVIVKSTHGERIIGDFTLLFTKGNELQNINEAIIYADMVGMLIENRRGLQKLTEKEKLLKESKQQLDTIISNSPSVIYTYKIDNDGNPHITFINGDVKKILGVDPQVFIDDIKLFKSSIHPDDLSVWQEKLSGKNITSEYRFKDKDGNYHWLLDKQKVLNKETDFVEIIGTWWDITENKKSQFETIRMKEQYELAVAGTNDGIWDWNILTNELFLSKRWKEMLGYEDWEIKNEFDSFISLIYKEDVPRVNEFVRCYLEGEIEQYAFEFRMKHKNGSLVWILAKGEALRDGNGKPYRMAGSHSDITRRKEAEEQMKKNKIRLEYAMDSGDHGFWDMNLDTNEIYCSPRYYTMLGYEPDEFVLTPDVWRSLIHPDDSPAVPVIREYLKTQEQKEIYFRLTCKDGSYKWIASRAKGYERDSQGNPHRAVGVHVDIDELKQKTEALKESHRMAKMGRWDYYHKQDYLKWTEGTFEIFELDSNLFQANYQAFLERVHPEDRERVARAWEESVATHQAYDIEHRLLLDSGCIKWVKEGCYTEYDEDGHPQHSIGIVQDITELKLSEEKLFRLLSNQELTTDISSVFVNTPVEKTDQAIEHVLQSMARFFKVDRIGIFQITPNGLYLNNTYEYCAQKVPSIQEHLQQIQLKKEEKSNSLDPCEVEAMILKAKPKAQKGEKNACSSLVVVNMLNDGKNAGFIYFDSGRRQKEWSEDDLSQIKFLTEIISNAISKKELTENLLEARKKADAANQSKSMFLANMNHELRTPLNGIIGYSDMLNYTPLNEEQKSFVDVIYSSAKHLSEVISDILDFSRIEAGKFELFPEKTEIRKLIEETLAIVRYRAESKRLTLHHSIGTKMPKFVEVDGPRLKQILVNLLTNAIKFTDTGRVQLIVKQLKRENSRVHLDFQVIDTGIGIKEKDQAKIFEPFHQADMPASKRTIGTGLGLAITKDLLEKMDSRLQVQSVYGQGSTFSFRLSLPCEPQQPKNAERKELEPHHMASSFKDKKVLIVEDHPVNMKYLQTSLGMLSKNIQVLVAENGQEGYEQYRKHNPDLILMDILMPKVNGHESTAMIRAHNKEIPIIAMTAKALKEDREACLSAGMNDFLSKPFSLGQLKEIVIKYLV